MFRRTIRKAMGMMTLFCLLGAAGCKDTPAENVVQSGNEQKETVSQTQNREHPIEKSDKTEGIAQAPQLEEQIVAVKENSSEENTERNATVVLKDTGIVIDGIGCEADGSRLKIKEAGVYEISGTLTNGSIYVNVDNDSEVHLILNGVTVHNETGAALYCKKASKVTVTLATGSVNRFSDGTAYVFDDGETEPDATVFAKHDLVINGAGKLSVTSIYGDAIKGKDSLYILGGEFEISAADDGIIGRDLLYVSDGKLTVNATADALKSTNDADATLGNIMIDGGEFVLTAGQDGLQAENTITVNGGTFVVKTGGGAANASTKTEDTFFGRGFGDWGNRQGTTTETSEETTSSVKGLKAGVLLTVNGGTMELDTLDDALHGDKNVLITGGNFKISSGDDGVHAEEILQIEGNCKIDITKSYEGLEGLEIVIAGGEITVVASDDGINAAGGADGSGFGAMRPGAGMFGEGEGEVTINGGSVTLHASGDGLDSNGNLTINGGEVYVYGPTGGGNGVLDYGGTFCVNGGTLFGIGSSDMAQIPGDTSGQYSVAATLSTKGKEGDMVAIKINGETVLSVTAPIPFAYVVASAGELKKDAEVSIEVAGTEYYSGTLTDVVTCFGMTGEMGGFGGFGGGFGGNGGFGGGVRPDKGGFGNREDFGGRGNNGMRPEVPEGGFPEMPEGSFPGTPEGGFPGMPNWENFEEENGDALS